MSDEETTVEDNTAKQMDVAAEVTDSEAEAEAEAEAAPISDDVKQLNERMGYPIDAPSQQEEFAKEQQAAEKEAEKSAQTSTKAKSTTKAKSSTKDV
jgi:hypothetical protein